MEPSDQNVQRYRREEVFNLSRAEEDHPDHPENNGDDTTPLIHSSRIRKVAPDESLGIDHENVIDAHETRIHVVGESSFDDAGKDDDEIDITTVESDELLTDKETAFGMSDQDDESDLSLPTSFDGVHFEFAGGNEDPDNANYEPDDDSEVIGKWSRTDVQTTSEETAELLEDEEAHSSEIASAESGTNETTGGSISSRNIHEMRDLSVEEAAQTSSSVLMDSEGRSDDSQKPDETPEYKPLVDLSDKIQGSGISAFEIATSQLELYRQSPDSSDGADALFNAAVHFQKAGLPGKARGLFESFLEKFPDHPESHKARQVLSEQSVDAPSEDQLIGKKRLLDSLSEAEASPKPPPIRRGYTQQKESSVRAPRSSVKKSRIVHSTGRPEIDFGLPPDESPRTFLGRFIQKRSSTQILIGSTAVVLISFTVAIFLLTQRGCYGTDMSNLANNRLQEPTPVENNMPLGESTDDGIEGNDATRPPYSAVNPNPEPLPEEQPFLVEGGANLVPSIGGFGLQVKFTANEVEANELAARFRTAGYRCGVVPGPDGGYRVVVGQYPDIDQARDSRSLLPDFAPTDNFPVDINQYTQ